MALARATRRRLNTNRSAVNPIIATHRHCMIDMVHAHIIDISRQDTVECTTYSRCRFTCRYMVAKPPRPSRHTCLSGCRSPKETMIIL
jgi:hypothetical protein